MKFSSGKQIITIHILHNISRSKENQTMKFGNLEYNMRSIFLEKCGKIWINSLKLYTVPFSCISNIERFWPLASEEKLFSRYILWWNIIFWLSLLLEIFGNMYIIVICFPVHDVITFESNLNFLIKPFSYMTEKIRTKTQSSRERKISRERKKLLRWNKKHFSSFLKEFHWSNQKPVQL